MKKMTILFLFALMGVAIATNAFAAVSDTINITATIAAGTSSVAITEDSIAFPSVTPTPTDHRFSAGPMTVTYFAGTSPWTIRVYTNNHPGAETPPATDAQFAGLVGADGTSYVTLKVWNANFGPTADMPDPEVDLNWIGTPPDYNDVRWGRIPEKDEHTASSDTWRRLAYTGAELPSPFVNYLAFDAQGVKAQGYTATLNIEIINQ